MQHISCLNRSLAKMNLFHISSPILTLHPWISVWLLSKWRFPCRDRIILTQQKINYFSQPGFIHLVSLCCVPIRCKRIDLNITKILTPLISCSVPKGLFMSIHLSHIKHYNGPDTELVTMIYTERIHCPCYKKFKIRSCKKKIIINVSREFKKNYKRSPEKK
jgi:hypothetical protein